MFQLLQVSPIGTGQLETFILHAIVSGFLGYQDDLFYSVPVKI